MAINWRFIVVSAISFAISYSVRNEVRNYTNQYEIVPTFFLAETLLIIYVLSTD